jgi:hypothetical protein
MLFLAIAPRYPPDSSHQIYRMILSNFLIPLLEYFLKILGPVSGSNLMNYVFKRLLLAAWISLAICLVPSRFHWSWASFRPHASSGPKQKSGYETTWQWVFIPLQRALNNWFWPGSDTPEPKGRGEASLAQPLSGYSYVLRYITLCDVV